MIYNKYKGSRILLTYLHTIGLYLLLLPTVYAAIQDVAYLAYTEGYWQVWIMNPDGANQKQLTFTPYDKNRASWFPDGKTLLVNGSAGELVRVKTDDNKETPVKLKMHNIGDAVISPDGKKIAFSHTGASRVDDNNIWVVNIDGSKPLKLTHKTGLQHEPVWSADGTQIYFLSGKGGQAHDIWRLTLKDKKEEQLTAGQLYHFDLALSAKNDLAFSSNRSGNYEIWIQAVKAKTAIQITENEALDAKPCWSPDGEYLLFESNRDGGVSNIWKYHLKDKKLLKLTNNKVGARSPVWKMPVKN